ncbi:MAG: hypothetical protein JWM31_1325 [Solirubrobacterales bacterium]|nr:hypothetical protein [Solirubrobacterales bacterium]
MRALLARTLLIACLALAAGGPGVAAAQSPFAPLPNAAPAQTVPDNTVTTSTTTTNDKGLKRWQEVLIFLAGVALLAGIGFAIVGDAKRNAPVTDDELSGAHQSSAAGARKAHSKAKARKKGKAQRQARKANR